jgi:Tol biopolymer transport system component
MSLSPGDRLGPYEIVSPLGTGGMGAVFRARDPRLARDVAIKILHPERWSDPERRQRFEVEARAASALNHPNILTVYDIGTEGPIAYMVTELVDGQSLDQLIPHGGFPAAEALRISTQIADALARAHAAGIIHRDLKPANVMLARDGRVKVLDFGLAKVLEPGASDTRTAATQTAEGVVMGTAGYMSPEQAEGRPLDPRSDIFSFGALLYELCTGRRAFTGDSQMATIAAVIRSDPPAPRELRADLPPELNRVIVRCLRKDPARRVQSSADLTVALDELKQESDSGMLPAPAGVSRASGRPRTSLMLAAGLAAVALVAAGAAWLGRRTSPAPSAVLQPVPLTTYSGDEYYPVFSPDGNQFAFEWNGERQDNTDIYVRPVAPGVPLRLTSHAAPDVSPDWSPDGQRIAFLRRSVIDQIEVIVIPALGGPETRIARLYTGRAVFGPLASVCWAADSRHLFVTGSETPGRSNDLLRISTESREVKRLISLDRLVEGYGPVRLSPDGRMLAVVKVLGASTVDLVSLTPTLDVASVRPVAAAGQSVGVAAWSADGGSLIVGYGVNNPLSLGRIALPDGRVEALAWTGLGAAFPAVSRAGRRLIFARRSWDSNFWQVRLADPRTAAGKATQLVSSSFREVFPQLSPDGRRLAFHSNRGGSVQIWTADADGTRAVQLTNLSALATTGTPHWSPDGARIAFDSNEGGSYHIYVISADGGQPRRLTDGQSNNFGARWGPDGRTIYFASNRGGEYDIWKTTMDGGDAERVTSRGGQSPEFSPDGRWMVYIKGDGVGGLWRRPLGAGDDREEQVAGPILRYNFSPTNDGVYYIPRAPGDPVWRIAYKPYSSGEAIDVVQLDKMPDLGLTVSPDGKALIFAQIDYRGADLQLVEGFR